MSELRPIQPEDLFRHSFLQSGDLSPDGRWLLYAVSSYDEESDSDTAAIWLQDTDSGAGAPTDQRPGLR